MCSYCGCAANTVIATLMAEHEEIVNLTGDLRRAIDGASEQSVEDAADRLAALLTPHTVREERGLFAQMRSDAEFREHIDGLVDEHASIDETLERIARGDYTLFAAFERTLRRHIDKEDNGLFPAAIIALDGDTWGDVAAAV